MKKKFLTAVIALTGIAAFSTLHAQQFTQTNAVVGDLILGFETTGGGGSTNLLVDLGSVTNTAQLLSLNINLNSDLVTAFGTNWASTVSYGLYSVTSSKVIYASGAANLVNGGYQLESSSSAATQKNDFVELAGTFNGDGVINHTTASGVYEGKSETYSWGSFTPSSGAFNNNNYASIDLGIGSTADLYAQPTGSSSSYGSFTGLAFTVSNLGLLTVAAVPEPSTYALFALGGLVLLVASRRRLAVIRESGIERKGDIL